jgi:hypothetical protein
MVDRVLSVLVKTRDAEFNGMPVPDGKIDPEQVIMVGKDKLA